MMRNTIRSAAHAARRAWLEAARDRTGVAAIEFALIAPVLLMMLLGIIQFGTAFHNYLQLTNSAEAGVRQFAAGRGSTTPYTTTTSTVTSASPFLTATNITITLQVNGTACASDSACQTALASAAGGAATVNAAYPCNLAIIFINVVPGCTLNASATELIE